MNREISKILFMRAVSLTASYLVVVIILWAIGLEMNGGAWLGLLGTQGYFFWVDDIPAINKVLED